MSTLTAAPFTTELQRALEMLLQATASSSTMALPLTLRQMLETVEKAALLDALTSARGNRARAARLLGTTERVFNYGVRKYGIDWRRFRI